jgi:hypothetical protein
MTDDKRDQPRDAERTATDEMGDRYRDGAHVVPLTRDPDESEPTGLPPGMKDSRKSPADVVF